MPNSVQSRTLTAPLAYKMKHYIALLKMRLSLLVVFSGTIGYLLGTPDGAFSWLHFSMFALGAFLVTGAANIINQVLERDIDKLMQRTRLRPLPTGSLSVQEAVIFLVLLALVGTLLLAYFANPLTAGLTFFSMLLYGFLYTPLKQKNAIAVFVGAFPGAFPPLIGFVAAEGMFSQAALVVFLVQFLWQFPHFWAIAWVADDDYRAAGYRLLPGDGERNAQTALQILAYTVLIIPVSLLPWYFGMAGMTYAVVSTLCGVIFTVQAWWLFRKENRKAALGLMFGSFLYLPIVLITMVLDWLL